MAWLTLRTGSAFDHGGPRGRPMSQSSSSHAPRSIFEKIWAAHLVKTLDDGRDLIFVTRHVLQETTSAPAFEKLRKAGRAVRHPELTVATQDHIVSTEPNRDEVHQSGRSRAAAPHARQCLCQPHPPFRRRRSAPGHRACDRARARHHAARLHAGLRRQPHRDASAGSARWPGASARPRSSTCWPRRRWLLTQPAHHAHHLHRPLRAGVCAKDLILHLIGELGIAAGQRLCRRICRPSRSARCPIEARLTICNMSIEIGARLGLVAPDDATFAYLAGRAVRAARAPAGTQALAHWRTLPHRSPTRTSIASSRSTAAICAAGHLGHHSAGRRRRSTSAFPIRPAMQTRSRREAWPRAHRLHGSAAGHAAGGHPDRCRLHRLVHQFAALAISRPPPRIVKRPQGGSKA